MVVLDVQHGGMSQSTSEEQIRDLHATPIQKSGNGNGRFNAQGVQLVEVKLLLTPAHATTRDLTRQRPQAQAALIREKSTRDSQFPPPGLSLGPSRLAAWHNLSGEITSIQGYSTHGCPPS